MASRFDRCFILLVLSSSLSLLMFGVLLIEACFRFAIGTAVDIVVDSKIVAGVLFLTSYSSILRIRCSIS